jgi:hypothetical protein
MLNVLNIVMYIILLKYDIMHNNNSIIHSILPSYSSTISQFHVLYFNKIRRWQLANKYVCIQYTYIHNII